MFLVFFSGCQKISLLGQMSHRHDRQQYNNRNICHNNRNIICLTISCIWFLSHIAGYIYIATGRVDHTLIPNFHVIHCLGSHNLPMLAADVCQHTASFNLPLNHQLYDPQTPLQKSCAFKCYCMKRNTIWSEIWSQVVAQGKHYYQVWTERFTQEICL